MEVQSHHFSFGDRRNIKKLELNMIRHTTHSCFCLLLRSIIFTFLLLCLGGKKKNDGKQGIGHGVSHVHAWSGEEVVKIAHVI